MIWGGQAVSFSGFDLGALIVDRVSLVGANLRWVNLTNPYLRDADLTNADLTNADMRWADLSGANLTDAKLTKANLGRAKMPNGTKHTRLPRKCASIVRGAFFG